MQYQTLYFLLCVYVLDSSSTQNIFSGNYEACYYNVSKNIQKFQNYTRTTRNGDYEVHFNLCNNLTGIKGCDDDAMVCVKKIGSRFIPNAGSNFTLHAEKQLVALNGSNCGDKKYKTIVEFNTHQRKKETFHLEGCILVLTLNQEPSCSTTVDGFTLDLSPLSQINNITVKSADVTYSLGVCNYSTICGHPSGGCVLSTSDSFNDFDTQKLEYDEKENKLIVRGKVGKKNIMQIYINCNWFVTVGKTEKLRKKYAFGVESKYACVKLPMNCEAIKMDKYLYNISKLNRPRGWHVELPGKRGKLTLNVCGPLEQRLTNECTDIHSQVCLRSKDKYIGYGSLAKPLKVVDDGLELELLYGSRCPNDTSQLLRTVIKFVCSVTERGPRFISSENCAYNLLWETPEACPENMLQIEAEKNDFIEDNLEQEVLDCKVGGLYDLNPLVLNTSNYEVRDNDGNVYYVNICRSLVVTKETYNCKSRGACFINATDMNPESKYIAFGGAKVPEFDSYGSLALDQKGGLCMDLSPYELVVKFRCSKNSQNLISFHRKSNCKFELIWDTPLVCKRTLLKCHRILNFDKITASQMLIKTGLIEYNFNLCDSQYAATSLITGENAVHIANTSLTYSNCRYTLEYKLTNTSTCENPQVLNSVYLTFECTEKSTDYYEKELVDNCSFYMKFWTSQACNIAKSRDEDKCFKKVERVATDEKLKTLVKVEKTTESVETVEEMNAVEKVEKLHRNCTINLTGGDSMNISLITPVTVISQNKNLYTIANTTSTCGDFICKNNLTVGSIVDVCPSLNIDLLSREIRMVFLGTTCNNGFFKVALLYRCKESQNDQPKVLTEYACNTTIEIPDNSICKMLQHNLPQDKDETHSGIVAGIVVILIIIAAIVGVLIWQYLKRKNYNTINKSRMYLRDCSD